MPISQLTTFKNKGTVPVLVVLQKIDEIAEFIVKNDSYYILGQGSNLIINPNTKIKTFAKISPDSSQFKISNTKIKVGAGFSISKLLTIVQEHSLSGLEFAAGVPTTLGGMIAMNFGCWGQEISKLVERVHVITEAGERYWLSNEELSFGYRKSIFSTNSWIIVEAELNLSKGSIARIRKEIATNIEKRLRSQPLNQRTFGSIFKNPQGSYAAKLIEESGLKGYEYKNVKISEQHANFMVNLGDAGFDDVLGFIDFIRLKVREKTGFNLELEVKTIK